MMIKRILPIVLLLAHALITNAQLKVANVFGDHMVLQRDQPVKIWGTANPKESIAVSFNGQTVETKASKSGEWKVQLKPMNFGGPFTMNISGSTEDLTLTNVLIGDVWIGSGQSNMEWPLFQTNNGPESIAESQNPNIRLFTIEKDMAAKPESDVTTSGWAISSPESTPNFSAVAYHFGRQLNNDLNIPVGLIHSSWGGTDIETWMSWEALTAVDGFQNLDKSAYVERTEKSQEMMTQYQTALAKEPGMNQKWFSLSESEYQSWESIEMPKIWESTKIGNEDGIIWFAKSFELSEDQVLAATLSLGPIDDIDDTYINGQFIGRMTDWTQERTYAVKGEVLKPGVNWLVIRVTDGVGGGGIYGEADQLFLKIGSEKISLAGDWKYKPAVVSSSFGGPAMGPNDFPTCLYNAMIAPITDLAIKGVIWYQGENNTRNSMQYRELFPAMINDWRQQFGQEFPFIWVQLANFMAPDEQPKNSSWAELREAQSMTLSLPKTGQAVIIDIGEANDIHPRNKKDVGYRLAMSAEKVAYDMEVVHSGPTFEKITIENGKAILTFSNIGSGLEVNDKYGYVKAFAIAGPDGKFVWAKAKVEGDQVIVWSEKVKEPSQVRYAWGDNPDDANLYNKEGLPASPFRTEK
ncbi:sialate O-acetylesterase [Marinoscillum sp.]|uniref:sialate O-acetylesterase n=1 Tax=Marinoscillum sp. TaxID=2024838 RepID=UPI003BAA8EB0